MKRIERALGAWRRAQRRILGMDVDATSTHRAADRARCAEESRQAVVNAVRDEQLASGGVKTSADQMHELAAHEAAYNADRKMDDWAEAELAALSARRRPAIPPGGGTAPRRER